MPPHALPNPTKSRRIANRTARFGFQWYLAASPLREQPSGIGHIRPMDMEGRKPDIDGVHRVPHRGRLRLFGVVAFRVEREL